MPLRPPRSDRAGSGSVAHARPTPTIASPSDGRSQAATSRPRASAARDEPHRIHGRYVDGHRGHRRAPRRRPGSAAATLPSPGRASASVTRTTSGKRLGATGAGTSATRDSGTPTLRSSIPRNAG